MTSPIYLDLSRMPDREGQLKRVHDLLSGIHPRTCNPDLCLYAQLARELKKLLPMEEPLGLGAVVKDAEGRLWVRSDDDGEPWYRYSDDNTSWKPWSAVNGVELMTPGVQVR